MTDDKKIDAKLEPILEGLKSTDNPKKVSRREATKEEFVKLAKEVKEIFDDERREQHLNITPS